MYTLKKISLLFFFATLLFTACRKDEEVIGVLPSEPPVPEVFVNGSFSGVVTDEADQALENALIAYRGSSTTTDENGYFSFKNVSINTKGSLVTAEKDGYFYNAKFVQSELNTHNFTKIKLIEKNLAGSFSSNTGGAVATSDGALVEFPADGIMREDGSAYTGTVNVYATWLDPTATDLAQRMPGDLRALNSDDEQRQLTTYGMIGVELEGSAGEALNIADGKTATIELPVPDALAGSAPASIPLWHFDEASGYWVEEGEAVFQDNKYTGTVSHFSFWNADVPNEFVFIEGLIKNNGNIPVVNLVVSITEVSSGVTGVAFPNENGFFSGAVPKDEALTITLTDECGEVYTASIGPFSEDTVLPTIFITTSAGDFISVSGTLVDCDNNPVTNGYLKLDFGSHFAILPVDASGNFDELVSLCDATSVDITGIDLENFRSSTTTTQDIAGLSTLTLPSVFVCDDLTEFATISVGGSELTDTDPAASYNETSNNLIIQVFDSAVPIPNVYLVVTADAPGVYTPYLVTAIYVDPGTGQNFVVDCDEFNDGTCAGNISIEFTTFETVGGFVIGSFSGILENGAQVGDPQEVSGTFKIFVEE